MPKRAALKITAKCEKCGRHISSEDRRFGRTVTIGVSPMDRYRVITEFRVGLCEMCYLPVRDRLAALMEYSRTKGL